MSSAPKVWFITGSSSGFGLAVTELALQRGDKVVATLRKPIVLAELTSKYPDTLLLLKLDVTQSEEVKSTFATARERNELLGGIIPIEALAEALAAEVSPSWNIKVTIVEPGPFRTNCPTTNMVTEPIHPAYNDPVLPSMQLRNVMSNTDTAFTGDPTKLAEAIYKLVYLEDPPLRLPLHNIAVETLRAKGRHLIDITDTWASWSDDMYVKE
ncbi:hypothetical protein BKA82DRAFT_999355 [Pisolithus tinctorius]|nr:hypothetical protein BKA82DRAFT_999355 [Pisolithus tinctorius]